MSKTKIAFFLDVMEENFDGVSITMDQIISRIPRDKFDAIFITPHPPKSSIGFEVIQSPYFVLPEKGKEYRVGLPRRKKDLEQLLDDFEPDLVHFSSPTYMGWYALKYGKKRNIPVTTIYHTHYPSFIAYYFRKFPIIIKPARALVSRIYALYQKCDQIFAPTESMRDFLIKEEGVSAEKISIWGRGVDTDRFSPKRHDNSYFSEIPKANKKVLFVSRLVKEKDPDTLIEIYHEIKQRKVPASFVVVGDGPFKDYLSSQMPEATFTGALYGDDLARAYASSDIFVFPSTTETFGNVVLEALASGLPVVAANAGGPSNIVHHEKNGFLIKPGNAQEFGDKIQLLVESEDAYKQMRKEAVRYAESQTWEKLSQQLFGHYNRLVQ